MTGLPIPPPAWWDSVPWWAFLAVLLVVAVGASPLALQALRGRAGAYTSREQAFAAAQDRLEAQRSAFVADLRADRDRAVATLATERDAWERERDDMARDRDEGWDLGRGMEDRARWHRHEHVHLVMRFNALLKLFRDLCKGAMAPERGRAFLGQITPAEDPPPVPMLRDVGRKAP